MSKGLVLAPVYMYLPVSLWRRANARNVRPYYPYWQYTDLFIFRFVSLLCLRSTLCLLHVGGKGSFWLFIFLSVGIWFGFAAFAASVALFKTTLTSSRAIMLNFCTKSPKLALLCSFHGNRAQKTCIDFFFVCTQLTSLCKLEETCDETWTSSR